MLKAASIRVILDANVLCADPWLEGNPMTINCRCWQQH